MHENAQDVKFVLLLCGCSAFWLVVVLLLLLLLLLSLWHGCRAVVCRGAVAVCCGAVLRCAVLRCAVLRCTVLWCAVLWCAVLLCWGSAALCCRGVVVCRSAVPWCCVPCHGTSTNRYENTRDAHCVNGQENFIKYLKYIIRCMQLCVAER
jgi:hypothetical protein